MGALRAGLEAVEEKKIPVPSETKLQFGAHSAQIQGNTPTALSRITFVIIKPVGNSKFFISYGDFIFTLVYLPLG
jgi:hypothetical protein